MHDFVWDEAEAQGRTQVLSQIAEELIRRGDLPESEIVLREGRIALIVNGYFLLNHAYKNWRIHQHHLTQQEKIAALTCASVITFQPFRPAAETAVTTAQAKCNEIFAIACAAFILDVPLRFSGPSSSNLLYRIMDVISASASETLSPYVADLNLQIVRPLNEYGLNIVAADRLVLNSLVSIFELLPRR